MRTLPLATAFAVFAAIIAPAAVAAPATTNPLGTEMHQTVVATGDLDLASAAGMAIAERRIHRAADQVCGFEGNLLSPAGQCREKAINDAQQALHTRFAIR